MSLADRLMVTGRLANELESIKTAADMTMEQFAGSNNDSVRRDYLTHLARHMTVAQASIADLLETMQESPFDRLVSIAVRKGWPTHFTKDLYTHDREALEKVSPLTPFVWAVYPTGTHLLILHEGTKQIDDAKEWAQGIAKNCSHAVYALWDGRELTTRSDVDSFIGYLGFEGRMSMGFATYDKVKDSLPCGV